MKNLLANWKTTSAGITTIAGGIVLYFHNNSQFINALTAILAGIGLLLSKDFNVTGGTKQQNPVSKPSFGKDPDNDGDDDTLGGDEPEPHP